VSIVLGKGYVISFTERDSSFFDHVLTRIRNEQGRHRRMGADYLAYTLMDAVVDQYFSVLEGVGERIEDLEEEVVTRPEPQTLQAIHQLKRDLIFLRRSVWPLREVITAVGRGESGLVEEATRVYLRDVYDHAVQVIDIIEAFRDMTAGMLDIYLSSLSNRMNEVMKVLTLIATIFMPLTVIVGLYGMNFKYMPELEWRWGYPVVLFAMALVAGLMVLFFKRKRWL
jgi:magnesium transporter